jgi:hypothetical protein
VKSFKIQSLVLTIVLLTASPGIAASKKNIFQDLWERIIRSQEQTPPRSVRGGICQAVPGLNTVVSRDRPFFLWRDTAATIHLYRGSSTVDQSPLWSRSVNSSQSFVFYDGKPLATGEYTWEAVSALGVKNQTSFYVMEQAERETLETSLKKFDQLQGNDRILHRIELLEKEGLLGDAVAELMGIEGEEAIVAKMREDFVKAACDPVKKKKNQ